MQKRAPTLANILVIVLFALSCFGLLLFLWDSFGGPVPLKPKGYRFTVELSRTLALAEESDVRISGVNVGHVVGLATHSDGLTDVTVEMNHQYAPVPVSDRMILRQKTLLGETFLELLPQRRAGGAGPLLADGGRIPANQVEPAVTLDDVLSLLDPRTRAAFKIWQQSSAAAFNGRGEQINSDFAELEPFVEDANKLVGILASQEGALTAVVHNTGVVFDALTERDHQLRGIIVNGERTFHALAQSSTQFADAFRALPTFERRGTATLRELDSLATAASPVLDQSRAWERELVPLLQGVKAFTPDFNNLLTSFGPLTTASKRGLPAFERTLSLLTPLLGNVTPVLRNFDPFLKFAGDYVPELQALFANVTAATEAHDKNSDTSNGQIQHYLRGLPSINPEGLATYGQRIGTNRANPYVQPGGFRLLGSGGLQVFSTAACANSAPSVSGPPNAAVSQIIIEQLGGSWLEPSLEAGKPAVRRTQPPVVNKAESTSNEVGAPACTQQAPFTWEGTTSQYPHVTAPTK
jgi:phospholipid/cholesterol/gamma-HCH transport system substrate-binding protein